MSWAAYELPFRPLIQNSSRKSVLMVSAVKDKDLTPPVAPIETKE
jgi:hypothetical protein